MERKMAPKLISILLLVCILQVAYVTTPTMAESAASYISVPYHRQVRSYYCGPASIEMILDHYGPDISQLEIADVARTSYLGTFTPDMVRAAHFSNLSTSLGREMPGSITGYTARKLGYASFECQGMTLDELKALIDAGYPIIMLGYWHYRVVVGYSSTHITLQDSLYGPMRNMTYSTFDTNWRDSNYWGLFTSPWKVSISAPEEVEEGNTFTVTATITYPCPDPFSPEEYTASSCNASIILPEGLSLVPGETTKKILGSGELRPSNLATVNWLVHADAQRDFELSVEAEGKVAGFMPQLEGYPAYGYEDRIGGCANSSIRVTPKIITASTDIDPDMLNLKSKGKWITAYIQLPEGYNPEDMDASTILLNGTVQPVLDPKYGFVANSSEYLVDHNGDGVLERVVKFDKVDVASWIHDGLGIHYGNVTLAVTGRLYDGTSFEGTDTIKALLPGDADRDGDVDYDDFIMFAAAYGSHSREPPYMIYADFDQDNDVDYDDFILLVGDYGKTTL